ncbi:hypothetical protein F511_14496 [Dorcoceras hygrometricum]|uniref:Dystroglycan-like n=1 Tax=Dorcoceras hygrometricum TaxID=472368 RepID=A0A2Z7AYI0_9LAMI|nr:hypothetical protein F511_14496 [Dorcoceras hygrometricum]
MASSLISNSHHVDFDSVFGMDDAALVQMFESLIATGLKEFLGCPAVFYEAALTEFFTNGSVREDGMVVSTIRGTNVEISENMFAAAFELPTEGLTDLSDVPKNLVFDARSLYEAALTEFFTNGSVREDGMVVSTIRGTNVEISENMFAAAFELPTEGLTDLSDVPKNLVFDARIAAAGGGAQPAYTVDGSENWYTLAYEEYYGRNIDERVATPSDTDEEFIADKPTDQLFPDAGNVAEATASKQHAEELMSIDDLLLQISYDMLLPSVTAAEITKIRLGESINIPGVQERDLYYARLPRISTHDKRKEILEEDEPVKGNPTREMVELICGDVEFLVRLRDRVMLDVVDFFHSFSLNKLSDLDALRDLKEKEKLMLDWAVTDSLETAKILHSWLAVDSYTSQIIDLLSDAHSKSLEDLIAQQVSVGGFQLLGYPDASYSNPDESYSESVFGIESVASYSNVKLSDVGYSDLDIQTKGY